MKTLASTYAFLYIILALTNAFVTLETKIQKVLKTKNKVKNKLLSGASPWGGELSNEAKIAAELVCSSVNLCKQVQSELAILKNERESVGVTVSSSSASSESSDVKQDGTPVTAADFAIQAYVAMKLQQNFPNDRFMGEEDASSIRNDEMLCLSSKEMAMKLLNNSKDSLSKEDFLSFIDLGVEQPRLLKERVWILDPIDGTKGLMTNQGYIVGLALVDSEGVTLVAAMGNPKASPEVIVAVKNHGLRYWDASNPSKTCFTLPRVIPNNWHKNSYDLKTLASFDIPSSSKPKAGVDYPPYLLSRPMSIGSPLPFGPACAPCTICCGSQVKYFSVARGYHAGYIQFQEESLKSWDHAPGILCVQESGGIVTDVNGNEVLFKDREFQVSKGIICCANEANEEIRERFIESLRQTNIT